MKAIDFDDLIEKLFDGPVAKRDDLSILGGTFDVNKTLEFLGAWKWEKGEAPWRIWEWASKLVFVHDLKSMPGDVELLERGRLFGPGGDLALRRDGDHMLWRHVGPDGMSAPEGFPSVDYWQGDEHEGRQLSRRERTVLLWGKESQQRGKKPSVWQDPQVGGAQNLVYPDMKGKERVQLRYREYLYGDSVEAVWWLGLEKWEEKNG